MQGITHATEKLARIASQFDCIACGRVDYIKYGNCWAVPDDWKIEIKL